MGSRYGWSMDRLGAYRKSRSSMPHKADPAPFLMMECSFALSANEHSIMTRDMVLSRLPDTTAPSQIDNLSHVPPPIISQESHFLGVNSGTIPDNGRQSRPRATQPESI